MIVLVLPQEVKAVLEVFYLFSSTQLVEIVIWLVKWAKTTIYSVVERLMVCG